MIDPIPVTEEQASILAEIAGLPISPSHMGGVVRNLELLLAQAALIADPALDPYVEPAVSLRP